MTDHPPTADGFPRAFLLGKLAGSGLAPEAQEMLRELLPDAPPESARPPCPVYLSSITAAGWRGIGPATTLHLRPGPGLTLVEGRNGSGKSSFAEAAEMALTGENARWNDRPAIWRKSWRNLHDSPAPEVSVELALGAPGESGGPGELVTVRRTWHGPGTDESRTTVESADAALPVRELDEVIDPQALELYRPFLPYSELGATINGPLSGLHDVIARILGLEALRDSEKKILALGKSLADIRKRHVDLTASVVTELSVLDDPRAVAATAAIQGRTPDLDQVRALLKGHADADRGAVAVLRQTAGLDGPDLVEVNGAVARLRAAAAVADDARYGSAENARQLAGLLESALEHRRRHPGSTDCPLCGSENRLDLTWAAGAREQIERLQAEAADAEAARTGLGGALRAVHDLVQPVPLWLQAAATPLGELWRDWALSRGVTEPWELADRVERLTAVLDQAVRQERTEAAARLAAYDGHWQAMTVRLAEWLAGAEAAEAATPQLRHAKAASQWLRKVTDELRDERLKPFADQSQAVWGLLCERSSVSLGAVSLAGSAHMRKVVLDVSVDDIGAPAFSVMSQGELHSLALSLFVPRATHGDSPFGFLVIDDPVQSMDPEKVEGLAKVLDLYARSRQVIVFTHDTRLRRAIEHLNISATVMEVSRQTDSVVRVEQSGNPIERALKNVRDLARDTHLPQDVAHHVLPAMCRVVLEAAYLEAARRRLRGRWDELLALETKIGKAHRLVEVARLVHYPDRPIGEVPDAIAGDHGEWARVLIRQCNTGSHQELPSEVDRLDLVARTERLAQAVLGR
ncbi:AAA family ATPase [Streptomyces sp. NPDC088261]|uniref:AAA family ATPase n=1 Tax=Streptomyces sp. NPDC088261 TaxID=3365851 RepID=UPI003826A635